MFKNHPCFKKWKIRKGSGKESGKGAVQHSTHRSSHQQRRRRRRLTLRQRRQRQIRLYKWRQRQLPAWGA